MVKSVACVDPGGSLPNVKKMLAKAAASSLIKLQSTMENEIDVAPTDVAPTDAAPTEMQHAAPDSPTASLLTCEGSTQTLQQGLTYQKDRSCIVAIGSGSGSGSNDAIPVAVPRLLKILILLCALAYSPCKSD